MDEPQNNHVKACLQWILMISLSPLALLLFLLMALYSLLQFLYKITLLFIIIAVNTPFAVMYNLSVLVFQYNLERRLGRFRKSSSTRWNWSDPRASLGIEVKLIVSDFFKVVAGELLVAVSAGIITYFTAPRMVFYASTAVGLVATLHKWLNEKCMSVTALSCLFDGYGLSPLMFLCSFIGFFDIGCHPVAKCSFAASRAFLFVKDVPSRANKNVSRGLVPQREDLVHRRSPNDQKVLAGEGPQENNVEQDQSNRWNPDGPRVLETERVVEQGDKEFNVEQGQRGPNEEGFPPKVPSKPIFEMQQKQAQPYLLKWEREPIVEPGDKGLDVEQGQRALNEEGSRPEVPFEPIFEMRAPSQPCLKEWKREPIVEPGDKRLDVEQGQTGLNEEGSRPEAPFAKLYLYECELEPTAELGDKEVDVEQGQRGPNGEGFLVPQTRLGDFQQMVVVERVVDKELDGDEEPQPFDGAAIETEQSVIEFIRWNAFERGLFQLNPRINFISPGGATDNANTGVATLGINRRRGKYILKSSMMLKLLGKNLCEYPVERLELPEDYSKTNELFNFLDTLSKEDGFVTDKMDGRYEHSLNLQQIMEGVEENDGYRIVKPMDKMFVVAGCTNLQ